MRAWGLDCSTESGRQRVAFGRATCPGSALQCATTSAEDIMRHTGLRLGLAVLTALLFGGTVSAQRGGPAGPQRASTPEPLKFRYMGPAPAGRIASVAGVPGDPKTYYLGSASGGVWKSTDGRSDLRADLRRSGRRRHRLDRRGRLRPEHCLGRNRRTVGDSLQRRHRRRRLQVGGRRQDVAAHGPARTRAAFRACSSIRPTRRSCTSVRRDS